MADDESQLENGKDGASEELSDHTGNNLLVQGLTNGFSICMSSKKDKESLEGPEIDSPGMVVNTSKNDTLTTKLQTQTFNS